MTLKISYSYSRVYLSLHLSEFSVLNSDAKFEMFLPGKKY